MNETIPIGAIEIYPKIKEIINALIKKRHDILKALDAAAGNGYMTKWLVENGFEVTALDINPNNWNVPGVECRYSDFNKSIEFADNSFDLVVSIETIEHLENPFNFIRELSRVMKPNGVVIISTPNVHSIRSRIRYFFYGLPRLFEYVKDDNMGQHISPVSIGQFIYSFNTTNLKIVDVFSTGAKTTFIVSLIFSLLNWFTFLGIKALKVKGSVHPDHYLNILSNKQLQELNRDGFLIVVAQKIL